ncbi:MAG: antitoxin [Spirochaetaceae bacterium]|nr:MAG: antitoxin [Spirochaetaceae bacterium]
MRYLDEEERQLIESLDRGDWNSIDDLEEAKSEARRYAEATLRKDQRMNIRMTERDLRNLKIRAAEDGLQYQTLVTMILHKYVTGQLVERDEDQSSPDGNVTSSRN